MRELEFLPAWYHQTRQRKRVVKFQTWVLVVLIVGLGTWTFQSQRNARAAQLLLGNLKGQLAQSRTEQQLLEEQLRLRKELQTQEQLIASLGYPVEMTRLLQTLDTIMPREMSLTEFNCETEELPQQPQAQGTNVALLRASTSDNQPQQNHLARRLKVRVVGVVPSDVDLANLLAGLTNVTFFDQVALTYSRGRVESGHVLREFEVTFSMNLNLLPAGN
jgi:hypothetical protein